MSDSWLTRPSPRWFIALLIGVMVSAAVVMVLALRAEAAHLASHKRACASIGATYWPDKDHCVRYVNLTGQEER